MKVEKLKSDVNNQKNVMRNYKKSIKALLESIYEKYDT